jgi:O-acetyl-ADP-ribose deacetylase (regulator of RNase III)
MANLQYLIGDATDPIVKPAIICHVNNTVNAWGAGFVMALSRRNKAPELAYHKWYKDGESHGVKFELGAVQIVKYIDQVVVGNMIAQQDIHWDGNVPPIRYDALKKCLISVFWWAKEHGYVVCGPRFGAQLSGGDWIEIEKIIKEVMTVETYIYTLEKEKHKWPTTYEIL